MTAGTGITHSEFNDSSSDPVHLYQIWLMPERTGLEPSYEQKGIAASDRLNQFKLVASPRGEDGALTIRQDARLYLSTLEVGCEVAHAIAPGRHAWLQVLRGDVELNGQVLTHGDGVAISDEPSVSVRAKSAAEVLLFDLA
jgi:hypothetical protein